MAAITSHIEKLQGIEIIDAVQELQSRLPPNLYTHICQVISKNVELQKSVAWDDIHCQDTNRINVVNVRALYIGIRAIETFLERVISHHDNLENFNRYVYNSYQYQLNQIQKNNIHNSIELDNNIYTDVKTLLCELQTYTDLHLEYKKMPTSLPALLPRIDAAYAHELVSRACLRGIMSHQDKHQNFKDTRLPLCHEPQYYTIAEHIPDPCRSKAVMNFCEMLELDVQNHILHPDLQRQILL